MARKTIPLFDTSVFADFGSRIEELLEASFTTSIVLFELVATSIDNAAMKKYERWRNLATDSHQLLFPTANDWWETSKAVRRLYLKRDFQPSKLKTLRNDALIARLAVVNNGIVVTHDVDDFQIIKKVMPDLKLIAAKDFFN